MKKKKRRSAAQKAATKKMLAAAKAARKAKAPRKTRRKRAKSLLSKSGSHRPVVFVKKRKLYRGKGRRSTIPPHATFANPYLSELALIGNPKRKGRRHIVAKRHRKSRRLHRLSLWSNPAGGAIGKVLAGPREMVRMDFVKEAASVAVGFALPAFVVNRLPVAFRDATWKVYASKVVTVSALSAVAGMWNKRVGRSVLLGGAIGIMLDLYADFILPRLAPAPSGAARTSAYYGEQGMGVYYGMDEAVAPEGTPDLAEAFAS